MTKFAAPGRHRLEPWGVRIDGGPAPGHGLRLVARSLAGELVRRAPDIHVTVALDGPPVAAWDAAVIVALSSESSLAPLRPVFALLGAEAEHLASGHRDDLERRDLRRRLETWAGADRLFVTRAELCAPVAAALGLPEARVRAVRAEAAARLRPADAASVADARKRHALARPFLFHPGGAGPAHNLTLLLAAFRLLLEQRADVPFELLLALRPETPPAGDHAPPDDAAGLERQIERLGLSGRMHVVGQLDDGGLAALYGACEAVVLPWLHQGLGLTVQEALHLGRPLLLSRGVPLPAGAEPAAVCGDARRPDAFAAALAELIDPARRAALRAAARAVAASGPRLPGLAEVCLERLSELRARRSSASVSGARPRLSLVTPSLDQGAFIERTLLSVLGQGLDGLEYVVMDGGSRDGTLAILRRHQAALRYVSRPDAGQADAVNAGLRTTSGDLVGWLNSDDVSYTGALDAVVRFFDAHPEVDLVYGEADHIDAHDQVLGRYPTEDWDFERLKETCFLCQPAVFLRRRVLERFGLLDVRLRYCMDYEYWLRVGAHLRPARLRQRLAGSRLHPAAKTLHARVAVHAEINSMLRRRLGFVPERWLHNYAWAVVDAAGHDRARLEDYAGRLTRATLWAFVRWRGRIPRRVLATAGGWLREARLRRAGAAARA